MGPETEGSGEDGGVRQAPPPRLSWPSLHIMHAHVTEDQVPPGSGLCWSLTRWQLLLADPGERRARTPLGWGGRL